LFSHPIYKGDYPPIMRRWVDKKCKKEGRPWSTLPTFTEDEMKLIKGACLRYNILINYRLYFIRFQLHN